MYCKAAKVVLCSKWHTGCIMLLHCYTGCRCYSRYSFDLGVLDVTCYLPCTPASVSMAWYEANSL